MRIAIVDDLAAERALLKDRLEQQLHRRNVQADILEYESGETFLETASSILNDSENLRQNLVEGYLILVEYLIYRIALALVSSLTEIHRRQIGAAVAEQSVAKHKDIIYIGI